LGDADPPLRSNVGELPSHIDDVAADEEFPNRIVCIWTPRRDEAGRGVQGSNPVPALPADDAERATGVERIAVQCEGIHDAAGAWVPRRQLASRTVKCRKPVAGLAPYGRKGS